MPDPPDTRSTYLRDGKIEAALVFCSMWDEFDKVFGKTYVRFIGAPTISCTCTDTTINHTTLPTDRISTNRKTTNDNMFPRDNADLSPAITFLYGGNTRDRVIPGSTKEDELQRLQAHVILNWKHLLAETSFPFNPRVPGAILFPIGSGAQSVSPTKRSNCPPPATRNAMRKSRSPTNSSTPSMSSGHRTDYATSFFSPSPPKSSHVFSPS